jgi:prephenate dehydrogenase
VAKRSKQHWERVAIVGVGLIGGSIGKDLLERGLTRDVVGIGRRESTLRTAKKMGAVTTTTLTLERGVVGADLIIVCTPVGRIAEDVRRVAAACPPTALITDAGSTKAAIVAELEGSLPAETRFVGSHPLAGGEKSGPAAATAGLFVDRTVVVTPGANTRLDDERAVSDFWKSLGAKVVRMTADEHDRVIAATSHLPHLAASALAACMKKDGQALVARGWLDTTRIAAGDPALWKQILQVNRAHVLTALGRYEKVLALLRDALERGDEAALEQILLEAKRTRDALGS